MVDKANEASREKLAEKAFKEQLSGWNFEGADEHLPDKYKYLREKHGARVMLAQLRKDMELFLSIGKDGLVRVRASTLDDPLLVAEISFFDLIQDEIDIAKGDGEEGISRLRVIKQELATLACLLAAAIETSGEGWVPVESEAQSNV